MDDCISKAKSWLAPYSFFHNDNAFKEYDSLSYNDISDPVKFLTYPPQNYPGHIYHNQVGIYEGVGKINFTGVVDSADLSITLITEASGKIKDAGGSHDQQDDGSISIRRVRKNSPNQIDDLVFDPGYAGYANKRREEFFDNHNTVQINPLMHGGINSCPYATAEYLMKFAGDCLGIKLNDLSDNLLGGVYLLIQPGIIASFALATNYNKLKDMPIERIASGGPGYSEMVNVYSNGFRAKITYDTKIDYALRSVIYFDDDVFVIDQVSSNRGDYSDHYNLPQNTTGSGHIFIGENGNSKIRLSGFCSDILKSTVCQRDSFFIRDQASPMYVSSIRFSNSGKRLPPSGAYCSFLSVLEPLDVLSTYGSNYTPATGDIGDAQICVYRQIGTDTIRYVFVNTVTNGVRGTIRIPTLAGWNTELVTDAEYGIIEFDRRNPGMINRINIYQGTVATYAKRNIDLAIINTNNLMIDKICSKNALGSITNESITHTDDSIAVQADYNVVRGQGYLLAHPFPQIDGDFTATVKVLNMDSTFDHDLKGLYYRTGKNMYSYQVSNNWDSTFYDHSGYCFLPYSFVPGQCWLRLERKSNILKMYQSWNGIDYYSAETSVYPPTPLKPDEMSGQLGICLRFFNHAAVNDRTTFSDFTITRPTLHPSLHKDFAQNTTLLSIGFVSDTGSNGWVANSTDGSMFASTFGGTAAPARITTPSFTANRNIDSGITIEFEAQFPAWYYNDNFSQNNTLNIEMLSGSDADGYSLVFMPTADADKAPTFDFQLCKIGSGPLVTLSSRTVTPLGSDSASWVKFRIDMLPNRSAGGTGEIIVYYDAGDELGIVKEIEAIDTAYSVFNNLAFTYTTGQGTDNYTVRIADISIAKRKSTVGIVDYRIPIIPCIDTVFYQGGGIWIARFGYTNLNTVKVEIPVSSGNVCTYHEEYDLDLGQSTRFYPGEHHSVFSISFDGSPLMWTLDSTTVIVDPLIPLKVEMKDNGIGEVNITKPQIKVTNLSTEPINGFKIRVWFSRQEFVGKEIVVDRYYFDPATITTKKGVHPLNPNIVYVELGYPPDYQLNPGATTLVDGIQFGVHYTNYYPGQWNKSNDWSSDDITDTFSVTSRVTVYNSAGILISGNEPAINSAPLPTVISVADVFGFESCNGWSVSSGTMAPDTFNKTNGIASVNFSGGGYQEINTTDLPVTEISGETSPIMMDFYVGNIQPNQYYVGTLILYANCPSAGITNAYIGQKDLTPLIRGNFTTISFTIPANVLNALRGTFTDFSFKMILNTNSGSGPYKMDNMRF